MAFRASILLLSSLIASYIIEISASYNEPIQFVHRLDYSNFYETITKHDFIIVEFYAPWCGHCIKLTPEYAKAASILSHNDPPIVLAKIDVTEMRNRALKTEFGIIRYPMIKIFKHRGKVIEDYQGSLDSDGIVSYVKKQVIRDRNMEYNVENVLYDIRTKI